MKMLATASTLARTAFAVAALSGCGTTGNPNPSGPIGGVGLPIDRDLPDTTVKPDGSKAGCPPGSTALTSQHIQAGGSIAMGPIGPDPEAPELPGNVQKVDLVLSSGTYTVRIHPQLGPKCTRMGPDSPVIRVRFAVTYRAWVARDSDPVCVFRSRADFSQFDIVYSPSALDSFVLKKAKSDILEGLDGALADQINVFVFNTQRNSSAAVRCQWAELPG